jgi:hypothetical protein
MLHLGFMFELSVFRPEWSPGRNCNTMTTSTSRTYAGISYDPTYFARKHRISKQQARDLIRKHGHDRDQLNDAAIALKQAPGT